MKANTFDAVVSFWSNLYLLRVGMLKHFTFDAASWDYVPTYSREDETTKRLNG